MTWSRSPCSTSTGAPTALQVRDGVEAVGGQHRQHAQHAASEHRPRVREPGLQDQAVGRPAARGIGGHRRAERAAPVDHRPGHRAARVERRQHRLDVPLQATLRGTAGAAAVAPVIDREHRVSLPRDAGENRRPHRQVAAVAVEIDHRGDRVRRRQPPGAQRLAVRRADVHSLGTRRRNRRGWPTRRRSGRTRGAARAGAPAAPAPRPRRPRRRGPASPRRAAGSPPRAAARGEDRAQLPRLDRLGEVVVEPGLARPAPVVLLAPAGERRPASSPAPHGALADAPGHLVAVHAAACRCRAARRRAGSAAAACDRLLAVVGGVRPRGPSRPQQHAPGCRRASRWSSATRTRHAARSAVAPLPRRRRGLGRRRRRRPAGGRRTRCPVPGPSLRASTRAAVQLDQAAAPASGRCPGRPASARAAGSACVNMLEEPRQHAPAAMPMPVSRTGDAHLVAAAARPSARMRPPGSVYLAALFSRLANTCASRVGSASRATGSGGRSTRQRVAGRLDQRAGWSRRRCAPRPPESTRCRRSSSLPRVMRDTSSRSSTRRTMWRDLPLDHRPGACSAAGSACRVVSCSTCERRCGSGPAGCAARGRAWPGTRPCGGRPRAAPPRPRARA